MTRERLATLISGGGTTMQEIIKACQAGEIPEEAILFEAKRIARTLFQHGLIKKA